jgi:hypothetical protein
VFDYRADPPRFVGKKRARPRGLGPKERIRREQCLCFVARQMFENGLVPSLAQPLVKSYLDGRVRREAQRSLTDRPAQLAYG